MKDIKFRLALDMDGVITDFTTAYKAELKRVTGRDCTPPLPPGAEPKCWFWPQEYGYTKAEDSEVWDRIKRSDDFWINLPATFEARNILDVANMLYAHGSEVYFITNRPGIHPHGQTCYWLMTHGVLNPQVIVAEKKGPIMTSLGITHFLDDKAENCFDAKEASPATEVFMLVKPYNTTPAYVDQAEKMGIHRISSARYMFDFMGREEKASAIVV